MSAEWKQVSFAGVVQGVGFRPALYRAAVALGIDGTVANNPAGVTAVVKGDDAAVEALVSRLRRELPPIARIDNIKVCDVTSPVGVTGFHILPSGHEKSADTTRISPDVAICPECLQDIMRQPRRKGYFLTNCTNCGPRFSIITGVPYDREATTMAEYRMCDGCRAEYTDPADRRFHAQPVACHQCGPEYRMKLADGTGLSSPDEILRNIASELKSGGIVMLKGIGGYNLLANAADSAAIRRLRALKHRPRKPFAVMVGDIDAARRVAAVSDDEANALTHWRAPIVVCASTGKGICGEVAPGCATLGVMLPYMGLHHELFARIGEMGVVVTSANRHGFPIIAGDADALAFAAEHGLPIVWHTRRIANRCDDSVVRVVNRIPRLLRRSRGYVPEPLTIDAPTEGIAAFGADITSTWALGKGRDIILSQYIGSLESAESEDFLRESVENLSKMFNFAPARAVVVDAHPGYRSSAVGRAVAERYGAEVMTMWHHHAHAVSVMAEYGIRGRVLAVVLDGTGAGPDGTVWGSELLLCDRTRFERIAHGQYFPLPGGDKASLQPWRMAVSLLLTLFCSTDRLPAAMVEAVGSDNIKVVEQMVRKGINSPLGCGAGRVWDAVAALCGLAYSNAYEAEAPILLENAALGSTDADSYPMNAVSPLDLAPIIAAVLADLECGESIGAVSARFHAAYAAAWAQEAAHHAARLGVRDIVLAGGVFQNSLLQSLIAGRLRTCGLNVMSPLKVPPGDGGIALGQLAYGAEILNCRNHA